LDDQTALLKHFFLENTIADDNYVYGLKYITEIGVKALSPGINDPGTALKAINFLTVLIQKRMSVSEKNSLADSDNTVRILFKPLDLRTLVYHFYTPFRTYGRNDITVMLTMFRAFDTLIRADVSERKYVSIFHDGMLSISNAVETDIHSEMDKVMCNIEIENINSLRYFSNPLKPLTV
jgi:uncharacterized membrane protein